MVKNICQNPTCWEKRNKDQWNKKANAYQSRKAYSPIRNDDILNGIYSYFCTTSCFHSWAYANLENIIERKHCPNKITEKIIGQ